ncbi:hypothetical protein [Microbispora sp. CA-102843]|uniref:hypothetical protein n=1 Tax=Microbispora sp. CA-102843 TaxID=3239952 RepID=UPI003D8F288B
MHVNGALGFPTGDPVEFEGPTHAELARLGQYQAQDRAGGSGTRGRPVSGAEVGRTMR